MAQFMYLYSKFVVNQSNRSTLLVFSSLPMQARNKKGKQSIAQSVLFAGAVGLSFVYFLNRCILCDCLQTPIRAGAGSFLQIEWHQDSYRHDFPGALWALPHGYWSYTYDYKDSHGDTDSHNNAQQYADTHSYSFFPRYCHASHSDP